MDVNEEPLGQIRLFFKEIAIYGLNSCGFFTGNK